MRDTISGVTGAACLVAAILIWTIGGKHTPRLVLGLVLTASMGLLGTRVGSWVAMGFGVGTDQVAKWTNWLVGASLVVLLGFGACYIVFHDTGLGQRLWKLINRGGGGGGAAGPGGGARAGAGAGGGGGGWVGKALGPHSIRNRTLVFTASLPLTAVALPGGVGVAIAWVLSWWGVGVATLIGWAFGIH